MTERVRVYDLSGNYIADPEGAIDYATGLSWETRWPQGYSVCSFRVRRSDVFASWAIHESYGVKVFDGATIVYQGRIETLGINAGGIDEYITVECVGWYVVLQERHLLKWWVDIKGNAHLKWPDGLETDEKQLSWLIQSPQGSSVFQLFAGSKDIYRDKNSIFKLQYDLPSGTIRKVIFNYAGRTGERLRIDVYNMTAAASEYAVTVFGDRFISGSVNYQMALTATRRIQFLWGTDRNADTYDQNDYLHLSNLVVEANYESGHRTSTPTYTQGELIEDILLIVAQAGQQLSVDFAQLGDPGQILYPYAMEQPEFAGPAIDKILAYGDASLNTWGLCVWDGTDTSDGLPRVTLEARSIADYEYEASIREMTTPGLSYAKISEKLRNNIWVSYENTRGETVYRTSADNSALTDATSIASEYRRDEWIQLGQGDATRADMVGTRFLSYRKNRLTRASLRKKGYIATKGGGLVPVNRVRAGQRVKLIETGEIMFIRQTNYDAESQTLTIAPDAVEDNTQMLFLQRQRGLGRLA